MATTDSSAFAVRGQPFRTSFKTISIATGNPIAATSLSAQISKDGGTFSSSGVTAAQIGSTGYGYVDLDATAMDANTILLRVTATGAVEFSKEIVPLELTEPTGRYDTQAVHRLEQLLVQLYAALFNR